MMEDRGIGVDIGGSHIVCSGVNTRTNTLVRGTRFEREVDPKAAPADLLRAWADPINRTIEALDGKMGKGIGFAIPGSFNYQTGVAYYRGNDKYESLYGLTIPDALGPYLAVAPHTMRFINDATAFGIGTACLDQGKADEKLLAITLGTGFGATFNEGGIPALRGPGVPPHGSLWHIPFREKMADDYFSTRWFVTSYRELTGQTVAGAKEVAVAAATDQRAAMLFATCGANLAKFLQPWLADFAADKLVIGGNIARAWPLMEASFRRQLGKGFSRLRIKASAHTEDAALLGGGKLLNDTFWHQVKDDLPER